MSKQIAAFAAVLALSCPALATLTTTTNSASYTGNGSTLAFTVPFKFLQNSDLVVTVDGTTKALTTDYTVKGAGAATGTVTFTTAPLGSAAVVISRVVPLTQTTSLRQGPRYDPASIENALDKRSMAEQQIAATHAADKTSLQAQIDSIVLTGIRASSTTGVFTRTPSDLAASNAFNIVVNPETNSIRSDVHASTIAGGGQNGFLQQIGSVAGSGASYATIGGGYDNRNNMLAGTISGGAHHFLDGSAGGDHAVISGGSLSTINTSGHYASIGGGTANTISGTGDGARIGGGQSNTASNAGAFIGGGTSNIAAGLAAAIVGGTSNQADANATAASVGGGTQNQITGVNASYGTISGGTQNHITAAQYGSIGGGITNTVSANYGRISGGQTNTASGQYAVVGGGSSNVASGTRSIIGGGASNTASNESAAVLNGQQNAASGSYCTVRGLRGTCTEYGQHSVASGWFAVAGDAQAFDVVTRGTTTTATATDLSLDGAGTKLGIADNTTYAFNALVVARRTDAVDNAAYRVEGLIKRDVGAATTAIVGTVTTTTLAETDATWDATAVADTVNGRLTIRVTGAAVKTIRWVGHIRVSSVSQ